MNHELLALKQSKCKGELDMISNLEAIRKMDLKYAEAMNRIKHS